MAVYNNSNPEVVAMLIQAEADVNDMVGYRGKHSPLYWAVVRPVAKTENRTKTAFKNNSTKGLLFSSGGNASSEIDYDDLRTAIINILIDAGANVNVWNNSNSSGNNVTAFILTKTFLVATALVEAGADVNKGKPLCTF